MRNHFHLELQRPELHNRLGENIVVFNYIVPDVAIRILDAMIGNVTRTCLEDTSLELEIEVAARERLVEICCRRETLDLRRPRHRFQAPRRCSSTRSPAMSSDENLLEGRIVVEGFTFNEPDGTYGMEAKHFAAN